MNKIIVATYNSGVQQLFTTKFIFSIGSQYKSANRRLKEICQWCAWRGIKSLDVYRMDGTKEAWLISGTVK